MTDERVADIEERYGRHESDIDSSVCRDIDELIAEVERLRAAAAGPWVKIEPGCEMPKDRKRVLLILDGVPVVGYHANEGWYLRGLARDPTHYAIINQPSPEAGR